jgi:hypothetical protein
VIAVVPSRSLNDVRAIMMAFAERTGLGTEARTVRRYLWTDAFAVCTFLSLFDAARDGACRDLAIGLIDQVHHTLGRHRQDDPRSGWISGLDEAKGSDHPTVGGLRIGKSLNERAAGQARNEREEWDRDGQYFHYLTKWMHALERAAVVTSEVDYCRWGLELAETAHSAFVYRAPDGTRRMYWKMSIDLTRPLVSSMGHHDPLDALVSYSELEHCRIEHFAEAGLPSLRSGIAEAAAMCAGRSWVSEDPLGVGGLLIDIDKLSRLQTHGLGVPAATLTRLLTDARAGLELITGSYPFHAAEYRLAFRELGLAIGLHAVEALRPRLMAQLGSTVGAAAAAVEALEGFLPLAEEIESFWLAPINRHNPTWRDHVDINSVMLATSLLPGQFLMV